MTRTPTPRTDNEARLCPLCGGDNDCETARTGRFDVDCWCREQPFSPTLLGRASTVDADRCICRRCAQDGES